MSNRVTAHDLSFEIFIEEQTILDKVKEMANQISKDYRGKQPLFLGILNGSFLFAADLMRACDIDCEISFVKLASYDGLKSSGKVSTLIGLDRAIKDRHVIILEDIIDSGRTLYHFLPELAKMEPASVALAVLLLKPDAVQHDIPIDYLGFEIPNKFVIGYGLDYNGLARNLGSIYQLVESD